MKKFSKFIKESVPLRIKTSREALYVVVLGEDMQGAMKWVVDNLSRTEGLEASLARLNEEAADGSFQFRMGSSVIHLAHGDLCEPTESALKAAKEGGMTTALISMGNVDINKSYVDINYKI